jgi:DNA adenine methylase
VNYSPLRYPGGKSKIAPLIRLIIEKSGSNITYIEPFAGGAGVALSLLLEGSVNEIVINDYDKAVYSFWRALKESPDELISLIENTPLTIDEWQRQKEIYCTQNKRYSIELGFSAFYLNRTNRSGILNAGPIGGYNQTGNYRIDARFNRDALIGRIQEIAKFNSRITVYNKEIRSFIRNIIPKYQDRAFVYFDPPYFENGQRLYKNFFTSTDHVDIAHSITNNVTCPWVITYDDVPELRELYSAFEQRKYSLNYSAANKGQGSEIIIFKSPELLPTCDEVKKHTKNFQLTEV